MNWQAWPHRLGSLDREMPQSVQRSRGAALPTVGTHRGSGITTVYHRASGATLERPDNPRGDPAAVEIAQLGLDALVIDPALIDTRGVERQISRDLCECGRGRRVAPGRVLSPLAANIERPIFRLALELAPGTGSGGLQTWLGDILGRNIIDRRVAGLE